MKKILIITSGKSKQGIDSDERLAYVEQFCREVEKELSGTRVIFMTYEDLEVSVISGVVNFYDNRNEIDLSEISMVHFKNWINDTQIAGMLARYAAGKGIRVYNSEVSASPSRTKIAQMVLFAENNLPVPDTFFASRAKLLEYLTKQIWATGAIKLPFVLKANDGAKGNDNYLINNLAEMHEILDNASGDQEFVIQAYQPNEGDYRFLYIGLEEPPLVFLRQAVGGSTHLNNTSKGGSGKLIDVSDIPRDYLTIAHKAAELSGREIGGVDILVNKETGQPFLLEVNQTPALATGFAVEEKIKRFIDFVDSSLELQEEE